MTHSRNKGNRWELDCIKFLKEVWPEHDFHRNGTMMEAHKSNAQAGDLHSDSLNVSVECKSLMSSKWSWPKLLEGNNKVLNGWLDQLVKESRDGDALLLMFSITNQGKWIAFNSGDSVDRTVVDYPYEPFMLYTYGANNWIVVSAMHCYQILRDNVREKMNE